MSQKPSDLIWFFSGKRNPRENIALDRAQASYSSETGVCVLRFYENDEGVSLGAYEFEYRAIRQGFCDKYGIDVVRRMSGGGSLYLGGAQVFMTLTLPTNRVEFARVYKAIGEAVCEALSYCGHVVEFREPNDFSSGGQKIGCMFLGGAGNTWVLNGNLICYLDIERMLNALRIPKEKLNEDGVHREYEKFSSLGEIEHLLNISQLALIANRIANAVAAKNCYEDVILNCSTFDDVPLERKRGAYEAFMSTSQGLVYADMSLNSDNHISELCIGGRVEVWPDNFFLILSSRLQKTNAYDYRNEIMQTASDLRAEFKRFSVSDLVLLINRLLERITQKKVLHLSDEQVNKLMVYDPVGNDNAIDILAKVSFILVPYCAKPVWCKWRYRDGCSCCGLCEVGSVYEMAHDHNLPITSIRNYEHLISVFENMSHSNKTAYLGMCCSNFLIKRERAFRDSGIAALLVDVAGANCYDLGQEYLAYAGKFTAEAKLPLATVKKLMRHVPFPPGTSD